MSSEGKYKFSAVKGNQSAQKIEGISNAQVLWESFGTDEAPQKGDLVEDVKFEDGVVEFSFTGKSGNALIAVKDASNTILWSWHIWCCGEGAPTGQKYKNSAGVAMDRNLGATSTTPGDVRALGLLYQWGRKDPFLGGRGINEEKMAASTLASWPVESASKHPTSSENSITLPYAISHPTTFITNSQVPYDWFCTDIDQSDSDLWAPTKTVYDPCPPGWKVPSGDRDGLWAQAFKLGEAGEGWFDKDNFDSDKKGMNFGTAKFSLGKDPTIWYPAAGFYTYEGKLLAVGNNGRYWSCSVSSSNERIFQFNSNGANIQGTDSCASANSVRCIEE